MSAAIRLVLCDDHPVVLDGLEQYFASEPDFEVVARCTNGSGALEAIHSLNPDVLVLDLAMPGVGGLGVLAALDAARAATRVVVLTAVAEDDQLLQALRLGAKGILFKDAAPALLGDCIRAVHRGERYLQTAAMARAIDRLLSDGPALSTETLTPREMQVVKLAAQGKRNEEIAAALEASEATIKIHLVRVYQKLGVRNRVELTRLAARNGWA